LNVLVSAGIIKKRTGITYYKKEYFFNPTAEISNEKVYS